MNQGRYSVHTCSYSIHANVPHFSHYDYDYNVFTALYEYRVTEDNHYMQDGTTPLYIASQKGQCAVVEVLVLKGANADQHRKV